VFLSLCGVTLNKDYKGQYRHTMRKTLLHVTLMHEINHNYIYCAGKVLCRGYKNGSVSVVQGNVCHSFEIHIKLVCASPVGKATEKWRQCVSVWVCASPVGEATEKWRQCVPVWVCASPVGKATEKWRQCVPVWVCALPVGEATEKWRQCVPLWVTSWWSNREVMAVWRINNSDVKI
jgi:head-tail adaptor